MLLKIGSILLVLLVSSYSIIHFKKHKEKGAKVTAILTAVSAAFIGFLLVLAFEYQLISSILITVIFAIVSGYLIGCFDQKLRGLNEVLSGFIGGTIGIVIGYLTFISTTVYFISDILFIALFFFIIRLFDKRIVTKGRKKRGNKKLTFTPSIILSATLFVILLLVGVNKDFIQIGVIGQPQTQKATIDNENNLQYATINVTSSGFNPINTMIKSQKMVKLIFDAELKEGQNMTLVSEDLKLSVPLKNGENMILMDNPIEGKYQLRLEPNKTVGTIIVK